MSSVAQKVMRAKLKKEGGRAPTLLEHCIMEVGMVKGGNTLFDLLMWTIAREANGGTPPTWEEFREVSQASVPAVFRSQKRLREVFRGDEGIGIAADAVMAAAGDGVRALAKAGEVTPETASLIAGGVATPKVCWA